jgi:hypothetical protein
VDLLRDALLENFEKNKIPNEKLKDDQNKTVLPASEDVLPSNDMELAVLSKKGKKKIFNADSAMHRIVNHFKV